MKDLSKKIDSIRKQTKPFFDHFNMLLSQHKEPARIIQKRIQSHYKEFFDNAPHNITTLFEMIDELEKENKKSIMENENIVKEHNQKISCIIETLRECKKIYDKRDERGIAGGFPSAIMLDKISSILDDLLEGDYDV